MRIKQAVGLAFVGWILLGALAGCTPKGDTQVSPADTMRPKAFQKGPAGPDATAKPKA